MLHTADMLSMYRLLRGVSRVNEKNRANSWNDCHSPVEVSRQQAQKKMLGFRALRARAMARASRISNLASGRGGPRYCGLRRAAKRIKKRAALASRLWATAPTRPRAPRRAPPSSELRSPISDLRVAGITTSMLDGRWGVSRSRAGGGAVGGSQIGAIWTSSTGSVGTD
jgi:hypothetical protein